jgi:hypothetical protein
MDVLKREPEIAGARVTHTFGGLALGAGRTALALDSNPGMHAGEHSRQEVRLDRRFVASRPD